VLIGRKLHAAPFWLVYLGVRKRAHAISGGALCESWT
jgi:hypothetical protein